MPSNSSQPAVRTARSNDAADHVGNEAPEVGSGLTMGEASRVLGVPAPTLRAWERRYGVPDTPRSPGGHRRFSADALAQIALLRDEIARGTRPALAAQRVRAITRHEGPAGSAMQAFLAAARQMDPAGVRAALDAAVTRMGLDATLDDVLLPAMRQIGSWWSTGTCNVAHEHLATATVRAWLGWHSSAARSVDRERPVVLACGPHDQHTIGLEALGALLVNGGRPIVLLGARTPARDLSMTVRATAAASVVVASQMPTGRRAAIAAISASAETGVPVFYAGDSFATAPFRCETGFISDLLVRCGRGDLQAFAQIVDIFYNTILTATALAVAPPDADQRVLAAFRSVWRNAPTYRPNQGSAVEWIMHSVGTSAELDPPGKLANPCLTSSAGLGTQVAPSGPGLHRPGEQ